MCGLGLVPGVYCRVGVQWTILHAMSFQGAPLEVNSGGARSCFGGATHHAQQPRAPCIHGQVKVPRARGPRVSLANSLQVPRARHRPCLYPAHPVGGASKFAASLVRLFSLLNFPFPSQFFPSSSCFLGSFFLPSSPSASSIIRISSQYSSPSPAFDRLL